MVENPFPGMNPYLEQRWGDVRAALVTYAGDQIQELSPPDLRSRFEERVFYECDTPTSTPVAPVLEIAGGVATVPATSIPIHLALPTLEVTESFIKIIDTKQGGRVVTIIELVSPWNKTRGLGRRMYRRKRARAMEHGINFVEIDLLRGGKPVTLADPRLLAPQKRAPYHAVAWRAAQEDTIEYYPFPLRQRLPAIAIPLRPTDSDVPLDLQTLVNLCYTRGRYDDTDYAAPLDPPLSSEDAQWVVDLIRTTIQ